MAFPVSLPDDGLIDLVVMTNVSFPCRLWLFSLTKFEQDSRGDLIATMDGAHVGNAYWHPKVSLVNYMS